MFKMNKNHNAAPCKEVITREWMQSLANTVSLAMGALCFTHLFRYVSLFVGIIF